MVRSILILRHKHLADTLNYFVIALAEMEYMGHNLRQLANSKVAGQYGYCYQSAWCRYVYQHCLYGYSVSCYPPIQTFYMCCLIVNYPLYKTNEFLASLTSQPTISTSVNSDSSYRTKNILYYLFQSLMQNINSCINVSVMLCAALRAYPFSN